MATSPVSDKTAAIINKVTAAHLQDPNNVFYVHVQACEHCRAERDSGKPRAERRYCVDGHKALMQSIDEMDAKLEAALGHPPGFYAGLVNHD